ncbi:MAG: hypothetical protein U1F42_10730 [Candidatus Competibacteraceae bacterium]
MARDAVARWLNVLDNVTLGSRLRGERPDRERALRLLARVGLPDYVLAKRSYCPAVSRRRWRWRAR